LETATALIDWR